MRSNVISINLIEALSDGKTLLKRRNYDRHRWGRLPLSWAARTSWSKAAPMDRGRIPKPASPMRGASLLSQRFFQALLRFGGEFCVRYFPDFFWKFMRHGAHVFELFRVAFAERTHEVMNPQLDPRCQRKFFVHAQRQNTNDLRARGRKSANEEDYLQLKPAPVLLKNGIVPRWPRIRRPF